MTHDEAKMMARILTTADGGCRYCVTSLMEMMVEAFPEHADTINGVKNDETLEDRMKTAVSDWIDNGCGDEKEPKIWRIA